MNWKMGIISHKKVEILELKNVSEVKNPLYGFIISRMDMIEK